MSARRWIVGAGLVSVLGALFYWLGTNTTWADVQVPMPLRGEALTNPTYAAQRVAETLGARVSRDRVLSIPPANAIIVLSGWNWNLSSGRRQALERWVEAGGRLVVDGSVAGGTELERWSGITYNFRESDDDRDGREEPCRRFEELPNGTAAGTPTRWICDFFEFGFLTSRTTPEWVLRDADYGVQVMRVRVGRGSVTSINAEPFSFRSIFDGDHAWLLVAATRFQPGEEIHFLSEGDYPSLLTLLWQRGGPVVVLSAALVALLLWRGGVRLGPLVTAPATARRSLAEQIRGTGQFALQHGDGDALHAALLRALDEAGARRIAGYSTLANNDRVTALSRLTGLAPAPLAAAMYHPRMRRSQELRGTIALLETARRRTLTLQQRSPYGT